MAGLPVTPQPLTEGEIDYRLARQRRIADYEAGDISRHDLCDAHPELVRAAREYSRPTTDECPVCHESDLVHVSYVFGPRLPAHGRCISTDAEMARIRRRKGTFSCYVVEVCPDCCFNHLRRAFVI